MIEKNELLKEEFYTEVESIKKSFHRIKKNIVNLSNLLAGKSQGLNKQMVITKFTNMMKDLYKDVNPDEINVENNNEPISNNNNIRNSVSLSDKMINVQIKNPKEKKLSHFGKKITKGVIIKSSISSSIKDYIAGKISANDTKFSIENMTKKKHPVKSNNHHELLTFNKETNKNMSSYNNINTFNNLKSNPRFNLKMNKEHYI